MKCRSDKTVRLLLALLLLFAWAAPACAGSDRCTMPCCQAKAKPVSSHAAKPCCQQPEKSGCGLTSDCPCAHPQALTSAAPAAHATGAVIVASAPQAPSLPALPPAVSPARSGPPFDTPVYLRTLSLLI
jgi:hypothetical protein